MVSYPMHETSYGCLARLLSPGHAVLSVLSPECGLLNEIFIYLTDLFCVCGFIRH